MCSWIIWVCFKRDVMDTTLTSFAFCVFFFLCVVVSSHGQHFPCSAGVSLRYTMAELLQLRLSALTQPVFLDLPKNIKPRKRGRQSGVRRRNKPRQHKPYLPAIIMGNVQSLGNKLDALSACVKFQHEYRMCSINYTVLHRDMVVWCCPWLTCKHGRFLTVQKRQN